jgi:cysteine desulfurase
MIYLDNNATTPLDPSVCEKMTAVLKHHFGNPSSIYPIGRRAKEMVTEAREIIADSLGAKRTEIFFTGSGTESDNFAIRGFFQSNPEKREFITTSIEHPAVMETANYLETNGIKVSYLPVDETGLIMPGALEEALTPHTGLISIMHANNEIGTIQPIKELAGIAREKSVPIHIDAVQSFGKIGINVDDLGVDLLSISAHKIYGPKGVGALYIRKGLKMKPLIYGGHQEGLMRAGTENTSGIIGMGEAVRLLKDKGEDDKKAIARMAERLKRGIEEKIPKVKFNGHPEKRIKGTLNFSFLGLEAEALLLSLATKDIYVSTGSACREDSDEVSHVLSAIGLPPEVARTTLRMSLGRFNTEKDVDTVLEELPKITAKLREISALGI